MGTTRLLPHQHCQAWQREAPICGESSPDDGGEELGSIDVGGGEGGGGSKLANGGQDGGCHGLV